MKIYLAPANHTKPYVLSGYNEKQQMELVAKEVQRILAAYDCEVYYPTIFNDPNKDGSFGDGDYQGRPQEAKKLGCDVYVAIHSNAAAEMGAYATGCVVFYHPDDSTSKKLAGELREKLDSICPIASNRYDKVINGMTYINGGFGEIREPKKHGITPVLIETNFHSYKPTAEWIVANISNIAKAIADVLISFYSIKKRAVTHTISKDNLAKLVSAKVITTPDYWTSLSLQYLNELCSNAIPWVDARVTNGITDFATALQVLSEAGIINTPAYWIEQAKKVKYIDQLVINMANRSRSVLEKIVYAEAGGEDEKGMILVANVIMNRVKNKSFPNCIYDVIVQTNQFEPVRRGTFASAVPSAKVKAAVDKALSGVDYSQGVLYFRAIKGATADCWHETALTRLFDHGGHRFYV